METLLKLYSQKHILYTFLTKSVLNWDLIGGNFECCLYHVFVLFSQRACDIPKLENFPFAFSLSNLHMHL